MNNLTFKTGDTLSGVALKNNTTVAELMKANPFITDPNKIQAGASYVLPKPLVQTIQNTTAQRNTDTKTQMDYQEMQNRMGLMTPQITANEVPVPKPVPQPQQEQQKSTNPTGLIDNLYLSGITDAGEILKKSNGQVSLDEINARITTLNSDPVYSQNAGMFKEINSQMKKLDDQQLAYNSEMERLKTTATAENKMIMDSIMATYATRRDKMKQAFEGTMANREKMGYQTDSFRYTPMQQEGLITNDEQNQIMKLAELDAMEKAELLQASTAKSAKDWDALSRSIEINNKISDNKKALLSEMLKVSVENNKKYTAEAKIQAEANDLTSSKKRTLADNLAEGIASEIAGLSDKERNDKLQEYATKNKIDINFLKSSVLKAETAMTKAGLDIKNKTKTLNKTTAPKKTTAVKVTADQETGKFIANAKKKANLTQKEIDEGYNYILSQYGASAGAKFQKAVDDAGIYGN